MKLNRFWQSSLDFIKQNNPLTRRFVFWYVLALILVTMLIVAYRVIPMVRDTVRLNRDIQEGRVYVRGQNPILNPDIEDFILPSNGTFQLEKIHPLRTPKESWSSAELQQYWDDIDKKTLKELRLKNQKILREQLQDLP